MLKFSPANTKLKKLYKVRELKPWLKNKKVYDLSILSGISCPTAYLCKSSAIETPTGRKIEDGPHTQFRCFSASQEAQYGHVYNLRKHNFDILRKGNKYEELKRALPKDAGIIRIHVAGDFFNQEYFDAWLRIAQERPDVLFYAYTKNLKLWLNRMGDIPYNLVLTASRGGTEDHLIDEYGLREAKVVFSKYEARQLRIPIDSNDSHAAIPSKRNQSFALLIHGTQPPKSKASKAWQRIKKSKYWLSSTGEK